MQCRPDPEAGPGKQQCTEEFRGGFSGPQAQVDSPYQGFYDAPFEGRVGWSAAGHQRFTQQYMGELAGCAILRLFDRSIDMSIFRRCCVVCLQAVCIHVQSKRLDVGLHSEQRPWLTTSQCPLQDQNSRTAACFLKERTAFLGRQSAVLKTKAMAFHSGRSPSTSTRNCLGAMLSWYGRPVLTLRA